MPLVSIAMTVYNGEDYLRQQVESVLGQTVQDIELVIVDDCSTDGSWVLMNELSRGDERIRIFHNDKNVGFKRNFERAISLCRGEYIALSDCDDIWEPYHLAVLLRIIGDKALSCGNSTFVDADGRRLGTTLRHQESLDWIPEDDMKKFRSIMLFRNPYQGATMLMQRDFISKALPIPEEMRYHDTWFASLACFYGGIAYTGQSLMDYRRLETSVTGIRDKRKSKLYRFLHLRFDDDRLDIINNIELRIANNLTTRQRKEIGQIKDVLLRYKNNRDLWKVRLYELLHYKSIYSCDLTHWL